MDLQHPLARNDDGQNGLASNLQWTPTSSGTYYIAVVAYGTQPGQPPPPPGGGRRGGTFTLTVEAVGGPHSGGGPCLNDDGSGGSTITNPSGTIAFSSDTCANGCTCNWQLTCRSGQAPNIRFTDFSRAE